MLIAVQRIACNPIPAAAPAYRAETRRSVIVQRDCCVHIGGFPNTGVPRWTHSVGAGVPIYVRKGTLLRCPKFLRCLTAGA